MKRLLAGLALALLIVVPVMAAPPVYNDTATLTATVIPNDPDAFTTERGRIDFQSDPYRPGAQHRRIIVWQCFASWWGGVTESSTPPLDRKTGTVSIWFRNGEINPGVLYCQNWEAWVALLSDWETPISPVLTGSF